MSKREVLGVCMVLLMVGVTPVYAGPRANQAVKFEHADRNDDGKVDKKEMKMERHFEIRQKSNVNTAVEKKYDGNSDGVLDGVEAKQMLKDKHTLISTEGKAKVDSVLEAKYDVNQDGIIDGAEAVALEADLKD